VQSLKPENWRTKQKSKEKVASAVPSLWALFVLIASQKNNYPINDNQIVNISAMTASLLPIYALPAAASNILIVIG